MLMNFITIMMLCVTPFDVKKVLEDKKGLENSVIENNMSEKGKSILNLFEEAFDASEDCMKGYDLETLIVIKVQGKKLFFEDDNEKGYSFIELTPELKIKDFNRTIKKRDKRGTIVEDFITLAPSGLAGRVPFYLGVIGKFQSTSKGLRFKEIKGLYFLKSVNTK